VSAPEQQPVAPPEGKRPQARPELILVVLDDDVLYWPECGHPPEHRAVLYDRAVCIVCDDEPR
jgi:hypothetical protein